VKKLLSVLFIIVMFAGCRGDKWQDEIDGLREELNAQAQLIEQLQNGIGITSINKSSDGYTIVFSDGRQIELSDGNTPVIGIGENGNWFIDGSDTGKPSKGNDGRNPVITIGANGNWFIDGVDTSMASKGADGAPGDDAPGIVSIVIKQASCVFYFSDGSMIEVVMDKKQISLMADTPIHRYADKYIGGNGNMSSYTGYWVDVYEVQPGETVRLRGSSSSVGCYYSLLTAYTETGYTIAAKGKTTNGTPIDEDVAIPEGVGYIAVTRAVSLYRYVPFSNVNTSVWLFGDSLTAGAGGGGVSYPSVLQGLLGDYYRVVNCGVGGETTLTIGARQGGMPMYIKNGVTIPLDGSTVAIPTETIDQTTDYGLHSTYNDAQVRPLLQGGGANINPCIIQGVECTLAWNGANYTLKRNAPGVRDLVVPAGTIVYTASMKNRGGVHIVFMGQNGGYPGGGADLTAQLEAMAEFAGGEYIVITSHGNGYAGIVAPVIKRFGARHIGLRTYFSSQAVYDAIDMGLLDGTVYPTDEDLDAMRSGVCPPCFLADNVHLNAAGYTLLGHLVYNTMKKLGMA
jgi:hypothetical protein